MSDKLNSKIPAGPLESKWTRRKSEIRLVSPNNKRKLEIIVVGTGLGGASAAASRITMPHCPSARRLPVSARRCRVSSSVIRALTPICRFIGIRRIRLPAMVRSRLR